MTESYRTLFDINFELAACYVAIVLVLSILGVFGNLFIIFVMKKEKSMNSDARTFITNMAVADLCVSGIADPMCIAGAFLGMGHLNGEFWFCVVVASMCLTACICVFLNVVCLTVNRWISICHDQIYSRIYNKRNTLLLCASTWLISFGAEVPNFFGFGGHYFDEKSHQCIWDRTSSRAYTLIVALGLISTPLLLLAYCNFAMFRKIWTVKSDIVKNLSDKSSALKSSIKSAKILFSMFIVFVVCWTPYVVVLVVDAGDTLPMEVHLFTTLLAHSHSSTSCIIYICFKKNFRDYLKRFFRAKKIHPSSIANTSDTHSSATKRTFVSKSGPSAFDSKPGTPNSNIISPSEKRNDLFRVVLPNSEKKTSMSPACVGSSTA